MPDTILDGSGEQIRGRRLLDGADLEIAYNLLGEDLVPRVNKAGVQVLGVVLENARKTLTAQQLLELKTEKSDLVVSIGPRGDTVAKMGFARGRVTSKSGQAAGERRGEGEPVLERRSAPSHLHHYVLAECARNRRRHLIVV